MSSAEANLHSAVKNGYKAFASVPRPQTLATASPDATEGMLHALTTTPLRELTSAQLGPYSAWAITTVGDTRDFRHFLPRIFELSVGDDGWAGADPPVMAGKLTMASWRTWPTRQQSAALQFFRAAFNAVMERHPAGRQSAEDWLCALITLGDSPSLNVARWRSSISVNAALQMAAFIIREAKHMRAHREVRGPFWQAVNEPVRREMATLLMADATSDFLHAARDRASAEDRYRFLDAALFELDRQG